jgi:hypothetical protein
MLFFILLFRMKMMAYIYYIRAFFILLFQKKIKRPIYIHVILYSTVSNENDGLHILYSCFFILLFQKKKKTAYIHVHYNAIQMESEFAGQWK